MAKHPHRLMLLNKKTWKCTIPGCVFFVHLGNAHLLLGRTAQCNSCDELFPIDEYALKDEAPVCTECRSGKSGHSPSCGLYDGGDCTCHLSHRE